MKDVTCHFHVIQYNMRTLESMTPVLFRPGYSPRIQ